MPSPLTTSRLLALVCVLIFPCVCFAGSFKVVSVHYDQGWNLYGIEHSGDVIVHNTYTNAYEDYANGNYIGSSMTAPAPWLLDNGASCTVGMPSGFSSAMSMCNGSYHAIDGWDRSNYPQSQRPALYAGTDLFQDFVAFGGGGPLFLNSNGFVAWDDAYTDTMYEAIPTITPEPSSLLLLATGTSMAWAAARRRRRA